jgi:CxxC motif-containing protein (DUF1111 family)
MKAAGIPHHARKRPGWLLVVGCCLLALWLWPRGEASRQQGIKASSGAEPETLGASSFDASIPRPGDPIDSLTAEELDRFYRGAAQFERIFSPEEGLGPVYNQMGCGVCHSEPLGSAGIGLTVTKYGYYDAVTGTFDPLSHFGGPLHHTEAVPIPGMSDNYCYEVIPLQANIIVERLTPPLLGGGLVEYIPEEQIIANVAVSGGRVAWVRALEDEPDAQPRIGRFGWKGQVPTLMTFAAAAARDTIGITNRVLDEPRAPNDNRDLLELCDSLGPPHPQDVPDEHGFAYIDRITDFMRFLAPPPQTPRSGMTGEHIFHAIGCATCHRPTYVTADDPALSAALRNREIRPYSDYLLHDMGRLGDRVVEGDAGPLEMRTPALWGLRMRPRLMHDGRVGRGTFAERMKAAIGWHGVAGSAAKDSARSFDDLLPHHQQQLIAFLGSLGRRMFDATGDGVVHDADFAGLVSCYTGPVADGRAAKSYDADHFCAVFDVNQDGIVDERDFAAFVTAYEGARGACQLWHDLARHVAPIPVSVPEECLKLE